MSIALEILAVSAGQPASLGHWQGQPVLSGIRKVPLLGDTVDVRTTNIAGDGQADMTVHGGADKAVYAYPADHWPWWKAEANFDAAPASFGENLTVHGADEHAIRIGDQFAWGQVVLEVSQPRAPCFKFAMFTGREDLSARMTVSTRTGWYFRVLKPGAAPLKGTLARLHTGENQPSVREAFIAVYHPRVMSDVAEKVLAAPALSSAWRSGLQKRLAAALNL
ncbi:MAG: MOSC domain-containing protein [Alphaproteobacteria bacterium]|nr:MOSC domain-containing protein [Alphaproteobacteria bacterium]